MHKNLLILTSSSSSDSRRRFFVYPDPKGSEEPSSRRAGRARRSQNQFTPLGAGVNKLIFKRFLILYVLLPIVK